MAAEPAWRRRVRAVAAALLLGVCGLIHAQPAAAEATDPPAWQATLDTARQATAPGGNCARAPDRLARVLCSGTLRVGVRAGYPPFAALVDGERVGFEIDLARELAARLELQVQFVGVTPANRIALLGEDRADLVLATMGHTLLRDAQALFVRPHYYQSQTVVVGRRALVLSSPQDLAGRTVCVTVGNSTNAELSQLGARLMLWADTQTLFEQLRSGGCALAAQDDSLFAQQLQQPAFAAQHELKLAFSTPQPWGAATSRQGGEALATALGLVLQDLHASGWLLALAQAHGVADNFLRSQQALWAAPPCQGLAALTDARCVAAPPDNRLPPTAMAPAVSAFEAWLAQTWGLQVTLAMLKTEVALKLFLQGVAFSLALVAGAVAATLAVGLGFGAGLAARSRWQRWPLRALLLTTQSTPLILMMVFGGVISSALGLASPLMALAVAVCVLGLFNGSNAGQAIAEARASLRAEGAPATLHAALLRARAQVLAFVVNATRGSPAASVIGVPELLSAQTDIASFSSERFTTFALLLMFYMALVSLVVWLGNRWLARWAGVDAPAADGAARHTPLPTAGGVARVPGRVNGQANGQATGRVPARLEEARDT